MQNPQVSYIWIDNQKELSAFAEENRNVEWMGFDTEFIGERRFYTLLCLIQISSPKGFYLIDCITLKDLTPVFKLLQDPNIEKITHAGENDYRLLYQQYKVLPKNVFDTQIAAGFAGYRYPLSFAKLVSRETNFKISKGYTVSDWRKRPMDKKQIRYALEDVTPLKKLHSKLVGKLQRLERMGWLEEEMVKYQNPKLFEFSPYKEAFSNSLINGLKTKEKLFLLRLYKWRIDLARKRDHSKEMVLPSKFISFILKNVKSGREALEGHRRLPPEVVKKHWHEFKALYHEEITQEEQNILNLIPTRSDIKNKDDSTVNLLLDLVKFHCNKIQLSSELLFSGINLKRMRMDSNFFDDGLSTGWRKDVLGPLLINWFKNQDQLDIRITNEECVIRMK
ncbi:MAG: ribonuclease D [Saprospiraceae bacterium]|nr:ribonuclease D [Saprospiraceae bacterium]